MQIRSKSGQKIEEEDDETAKEVRQMPAVGGPVKKINARMAYLSNRETKN